VEILAINKCPPAILRLRHFKNIGIQPKDVYQIYLPPSPGHQATRVVLVRDHTQIKKLLLKQDHIPGAKAFLFATLSTHRAANRAGGNSTIILSDHCANRLQMT
jgi:hypothetical protein